MYVFSGSDESYVREKALLCNFHKILSYFWEIMENLSFLIDIGLFDNLISCENNLILWSSDNFALFNHLSAQGLDKEGKKSKQSKKEAWGGSA